METVNMWHRWRRHLRVGRRFGGDEMGRLKKVCDVSKLTL